MRILIDSSVLLDIFTEDPDWLSWSSEQIEHHAEIDILTINPIIYAEVSLHFSRIEDLDEALPKSDFNREELPWEAGFLAARAFQIYRRRGGTKTSQLPDFYIGAHAAVKGMAILTRDPRRIRDYFPHVQIFCPE